MKLLFFTYSIFLFALVSCVQTPQGLAKGYKPASSLNEAFSKVQVSPADLPTESMLKRIAGAYSNKESRLREINYRGDIVPVTFQRPGSMQVNPVDDSSADKFLMFNLKKKRSYTQIFLKDGSIVRIYYTWKISQDERKIISKNLLYTYHKIGDESEAILYKIAKDPPLEEHLTISPNYLRIDNDRYYSQGGFSREQKAVQRKWSTLSANDRRMRKEMWDLDHRPYLTLKPMTAADRQEESWGSAIGNAFVNNLGNFSAELNKANQRADEIRRQYPARTVRSSSAGQTQATSKLNNPVVTGSQGSSRRSDTPSVRLPSASSTNTRPSSDQQKQVSKRQTTHGLAITWQNNKGHWFAEGPLQKALAWNGYKTEKEALAKACGSRHSTHYLKQLRINIPYPASKGVRSCNVYKVGVQVNWTSKQALTSKYNLRLKYAQLKSL